jgi:hypothetical protein
LRIIVTLLPALMGAITCMAGRRDDAVQIFLAPVVSFNAKWDRCEALARKRGTPPGTSGYGDFIDGCVRVAETASAAPPNSVGRQDSRRTQGRIMGSR